MANDALPIPVQVDTITTLPGGGVRMLSGMITVDGKQIPVVVQAVSIVSADGVVLDDLPGYNINLRILRELREMRKLMCLQLGIPLLEEGDDLPPRSSI